MLGIMLIDMQEKFRSDMNKRLIDNQKRLLTIATQKKIPILALEYIQCGETIHELMHLLGEQKRIIPKYNNNGFVINQNRTTGRYAWEDRHIKEYCYGKNWELLNTLKLIGITSIIMTGVTKPVCYGYTALGAKQEGFNVLTSEDLTDSPGNSINFFKQMFNHYNTLDELLTSIQI